MLLDDRRYTGLILTLLIVTITFFNSSHASDDYQSSKLVGVTFEDNDIGLKDTNVHYTGGVRLSWLASDSGAPLWVGHITDALPFFAGRGGEKVSYALGLSIFDMEIGASDTSESEADYPPNAGWLYGSMLLDRSVKVHQESLLLAIGIVGPLSYAEEIQRAWHRVRNIEIVEWESQLENELGIVLGYQRRWRQPGGFTLFGLDSEFTPYAGFTVGNIYTTAAAGGMLRLGKSLDPEEGIPCIKPCLGAMDYFAVKKQLRSYFFLDVELRPVLRNIFLDGNTFRDSDSVDKHRFVQELQAGFVVNYDNLSAGFTQIFRSEQFEGQKGLEHIGKLQFRMVF